MLVQLNVLLISIEYLNPTGIYLLKTFTVFDISTNKFGSRLQTFRSKSPTLCRVDIGGFEWIKTKLD